MAEFLYWLHTEDTDLVKRYQKALVMGETFSDPKSEIAKQMSFTYDVNEGYTFPNPFLSNGTDLSYLMPALRKAAYRLMAGLTDCAHLDVCYYDHDPNLVTWCVIDYISKGGSHGKGWQ